jgi:hypothetical protein
MAKSLALFRTRLKSLRLNEIVTYLTAGVFVFVLGISPVRCSAAQGLR